MTGPGRRFDPAELRADGSDASDAEYAKILAAARELETLAGRDLVVPTPDFDDRVMAAIAHEAPPRVIVAGRGGIGGRVAAFVLAVGSAWRVGTSGGRPVAVRAQALAFVLLVVLAGGSLASVAAIGAANLLSQPTGPNPTVAPIQPLRPTPTTSPEPTTDGSESVGPTDASETPEAAETPDATDDHETAEPTKTPKPAASPTKTPRPTRTPRATETPEPDESEDPDESDDSGGSGGSGESDDHGGGGPG